MKSTGCSMQLLVSQTLLLFHLTCALQLPCNVFLTAVLPGSHFVTAQDVITRRGISAPKRIMHPLRVGFTKGPRSLSKSLGTAIMQTAIRQLSEV